MREIYRKVTLRFKFNRKRQQSFLEDLSSLLNDGVSLKEAVLVIETVSTGCAKQVAIDINTALARGQNMADGLLVWFSTTTVEIIRAGEMAGTLSNALHSAASALGRQSSLIESILSSVTYPLVVLTLALIMLVVIKRTVLENFATITPILQWPSSGISLYHLATFIQCWWWALLFSFFLMGYAAHRFFSNYTGDWRCKIDAYPIFGFYRDTVAARFMQTLGLLISNGIVVKKALNILSYEAEPYLAWHIMMMEYRLSGGIDNIAEVLDTQLLKSDELLRLKIIAKGKGFAPALIKLGEQSTQRNQRFAVFTGKILGGTILVAAASVAANIIFGIYAVGSALAR